MKTDGWHHFHGPTCPCEHTFADQYNLWRGGIVRGKVSAREGGQKWQIEWADEHGVQQGAGLVDGTLTDAQAEVEKELR